MAGQPQASVGDDRILRAVYRDDRAILLVALPAPGTSRAPVGECAKPLLIDPASGQATAIGQVEATRRVTTMQLVGATNGTCPKYTPKPPARGACGSLPDC
ncbi:hypothetical protein [Novosphingobium sp. FKTRR1]|uniref:hypothetical protein n=1 Tax=Novosphingobium sp. FKTRR1 TaxID=2879118 RepID=UPI001CF0AE5E|nr:hypothetical protein [Novosphingobium sp. FKTRR1]